MPTRPLTEKKQQFNHDKENGNSRKRDYFPKTSNVRYMPFSEKRPKNNIDRSSLNLPEHRLDRPSTPSTVAKPIAPPILSSFHLFRKHIFIFSVHKGPTTSSPMSSFLLDPNTHKYLSYKIFEQRIEPNCKKLKIDHDQAQDW